MIRSLAPLAPLAMFGVCTCVGCGTEFAVDGARMQARVVHQVEAGPRIPGTPGHAAIGGWIADELTRLGGRLERQAFTDSSLGRPLALTNLIGRFGPQSGRRIVLCAEASGFSVKTMGELKQDASVGEQVSVLNLASKKTIMGQLVDVDTVRVGF